MGVRSIRKMAKANPTMEGAGVKLHRVFGFHDTKAYDPFLLLDDFRGDDPEDYEKGFPWHPHRGIETITYMLAGRVEHGDSLGNSGSVNPGGVQWMTAGNGIIHQEMPKGEESGRMYGFQLWANLAASDKMCAPRYQEFGEAEMPEAVEEDGCRARVICGSLWGESGPVERHDIDPLYADVTIPPGMKKRIPVGAGRTVFAYVFEGGGYFTESSEPFSFPSEPERWIDTEPPVRAGNRTLVLFDGGGNGGDGESSDEGDEIFVRAGEEGVRFLLAAGRPIGEPVAWYGPIVMNTREELKQAFDELNAGTFLKHRE